jgi:hypothetical protein
MTHLREKDVDETSVGALALVKIVPWGELDEV